MKFVGIILLYLILEFLNVVELNDKSEMFISGDKKCHRMLSIEYLQSVSGVANA